MAKHYGTFYGQHEDERVLYTVHAPKFIEVIQLAKILLAALVILVGFTVIGARIPLGGNMMILIGLVLAFLIGGVGVMMTLMAGKNNVAYITDRRVIRFQADTPWTINSRSLSWSEAVKVKTFTSSLLWRMLNVGTVVVHAKSTFITSDEPKSKTYVSDDDVQLDKVWFYQDLGNYIDKILYLYQKKPSSLETLRPFVTKPKGKRG